MTKKFIYKLCKLHMFTLFLLLSLILSFELGTKVQAADDSPSGLNNPTYTLTSTNGNTVSTKANPNEITVLIFGHTKCSYTRTTLNSISSCDWVKRPDIRVIFAETNGHTQEEVLAYEQGYQCEDMTFCYSESDQVISAMIGYTGLYNMTGGKYPVIVLIDKNNKVQNLLTGTKTADEILAEINKFELVDGGGSTPPSSESGSGIENYAYGLNAIDGSIVSTKANPNETTVLLFGYTTCGYTKATLQSIVNSSLAGRSDIRVIFADVYGASLAETKEFAQNYSSGNFIFCHDESMLNYNFALSYLGLYNYTGGTFPYIVLIDKNNKIQSITLGPKTADEIIAEIEKFTKDDQTSGNPVKPPVENPVEPPVENPVTIVPNVTGLKAKSTAKNVTLTWNKVSAANGYIIYQYNSSKKTWAKKATVKKNTASYKITGLTSGTNFRFAVKAFIQLSDSEQVISKSYTSVYTATAPSAVKFTVKPGKNKATIKWNKVKGATGYTVYYKTKAKGSWKKLKTTKSTSYTKTKLKSGATYYFTVKAYRTYKKTTYTSSYSSKKVKMKS